MRDFRDNIRFLSAPTNLAMPPYLTHETISGRRIRYHRPVTGRLSAFLVSLHRAVDDPEVTHEKLLGVSTSAENPVLFPGGPMGRGLVTPAVLADPVYHVIQDLLDRKALTEGRFDLHAAAARYTMTVEQAAARLGVHVTVVAAAIDRFQIGAWRRDGAFFLDPSTVEAMAGIELMPTALFVTLGRQGERGLRLAGADLSALQRVASPLGGLWTGSIAFTATIGVLWTLGDRARFFSIEPAGLGVDEYIGNAEILAVRGPFRVVQHENNAWRARQAFIAAKKGARTDEDEA